MLQVGFYLGFVSLWLEIQLESPDAKPRYCIQYNTIQYPLFNMVNVLS